MLVRISLLLVFVLGLALPQETTMAAGPTIAKGKGEQCVRDTSFMRKNHMELLLHQRDETMHKGIRPKQESLKECLSCHAVHDDKGVAVTSASPDHFCRSCHDYAAVKVDCFQCHASRPEESDK